MSYTCDYRKKAFSSTDVSDPSINEANDSSVKLKKRYVTLVFLVLLNTAALTDIYCIFFTFSQLNVVDCFVFDGSLFITRKNK